MAIGAIGSDFNTFGSRAVGGPSPASGSGSGGGGEECCCNCQSGQDSVGLSEEAMMMLMEMQQGR